jgi:hypothetical protein
LKKEMKEKLKKRKKMNAKEKERKKKKVKIKKWEFGLKMAHLNGKPTKKT